MKTPPEEVERILATMTRDQFVLFGELHLDHGRLASRLNEVRRICKDPVGPVAYRDGIPERVVFARDILRIVEAE